MSDGAFRGAFHGDAELAPGLVDLAVNVHPGMPPRWLRDRLAAVDLAAYPEPTAAREAIAARHGRCVDEVLPTAGAAEAFVLLARAFAPRQAVVVHPQFTVPEDALRAADRPVHRVLLRWPFTLDGLDLPVDADLVVIGNPTNPTSVQHPAVTLERLAKPGRLLVVDEAFADCVPGEPESLAHRRDIPGLVVVRSLTKTWGLAGLRAGYVLAEPAVIQALAAAQPPWPVSAPALAACVACCAPDAVREAEQWAFALREDRSHLLGELAGYRVVPDPAASFVLVRAGRVREALRDKGFAVRRGETFPGLDDTWIRVAVRDRATSTAFVTALNAALRAPSGRP